MLCFVSASVSLYSLWVHPTLDPSPPFPHLPLQDTGKSVFSDPLCSSSRTNLELPLRTTSPPATPGCTFSYKENNDSICSPSSLCSGPKLSCTTSPSKTRISSYTGVPTRDPILACPPIYNFLLRIILITPPAERKTITHPAAQTRMKSQMYKLPHAHKKRNL